MGDTHLNDRIERRRPWSGPTLPPCKRWPPSQHHRTGNYVGNPRVDILEQRREALYVGASNEMNNMISNAVT